MSTRSYIGITDGKDVEAIFCHWDGYLAYNGTILAAAYQSPEKVKKLIKAGVIDSMGCELVPAFTPVFNVSENDFCVLSLNKIKIPYDYKKICERNSNLHFCTTYIEGGTPEHFKLSTIHKELGTHIEYIYVFNTSKNKWYVMNHYDINEKWYDLKKLCTNKEYFYKYKSETGSYEKWMDIKTGYNEIVKELGHPETILPCLNYYLHKATENNKYLIKKNGDVYSANIAGAIIEHKDPAMLLYRILQMNG